VRKVVAQDQEAGFKLNLGEYFRVLWRKKYFLIVPLLISVVVSNIGVRFLVPEYESSTVIRIGSMASGPNTEVDRFFQADGRRRSRDAEVGMQLEADVLGSAFLDDLIRRLGMDRDADLIRSADNQRRALYPGVTTDELVMRRLRNFLKRRISIDREGPSLYRIAYADANPEACYVIADAISRLYIENQKEQQLRSLTEVSKFSEDQLAIAKARLDRSERELAAFQQQQASLGATTNPVTQSNSALAERLRKDLNLSISSAEATLERIRRPMADQLNRVPGGDRIWTDPELRKLIADLKSRRQSEVLFELAGGPAGGASTAPEDAGLLAASQQSVQRRLGLLVADRFPDVPIDYRPLVVEYFYQQAEIDALREKRDTLERYIDAFRRDVQLAPQQATELTRLLQEVEKNRDHYNTFLKAQETTRISEEAANTNLGTTVFLVEAANRPLAPVRPDKIRILILAFVLGSAIGAGGLLLTEFTDSSFRSVEEVEKTLGLKVLGTVPRFEKTRWFHDSTRRRAIIWSVTVAVLVGLCISAFYFYGKSMRESLIDLNISHETSGGGQR
jgi:uncharacterized protein involved in exopolysaccharide biosynthesis